VNLWIVVAGFLVVVGRSGVVVGSLWGRSMF
jgi:hypothetical protein